MVLAAWREHPEVSVTAGCCWEAISLPVGDDSSAQCPVGISWLFVFPWQLNLCEVYHCTMDCLMKVQSRIRDLRLGAMPMP
mmetsp:Transcript_14736/g.31486  ORF Transcript_14736/g.31486 Transcript_14736/m.31486 type:complete len:81 (+) Transcript_14736:356-598(+)